MNTRIFRWLIGITLLLVQCQANNKSNKDSSGILLDSLTNPDTIKVDSNNRVTYMLLSPNEILGEIFIDKNALNLQLINPIANAAKYVDTKHEALNLGVYIADFAYLNLNENKTNALEYFKTIRDLAQKINIYGYFNKEFFDRIEKNLAKTDSLIRISQEMYYSMSDLLENASRQSIFALISSGALIESLYLSTMNVSKLADYQNIAKKIFEQKFIFDNFYDFTYAYRNDADVRAVLRQLDTLKKILQEAEKNSTAKTVSEGEGDKVVISGGDDIQVNDKIFNSFKESVVKTRQEIVNVTK
jgi:hypothetical protein